MGEPKDFLVLVDFDGTITQKDVGADLFNTYSKEKSQKIVSRWVKGEISSRECLERECQLIKITEAELKKFALRQKIDVKFPTFVDYCKGEHLRLVILSDGLDLYIKLILKKYGLNEVPFYSNVLSFNNGELSLKFPFFDRGCGNCGNCKRYHISRLRGKTKRVIYIGDGLSDKCAVREADFVFAKKDLRKFCKKADIWHFPYSNFGDIIRILPEVIFKA